MEAHDFKTDGCYIQPSKKQEVETQNMQKVPNQALGI